jgi:ABC-type glycerol-3-phosphate transport system substrate-binding protein
MGIGLRPKNQNVTLSVWGIDKPEAFEAANGGFGKEFPGTEIDYTQIPEANYEETLVDALAAGQGPDIFAFRSDWIMKHGNKVVPAPEDTLSVSRFTGLFPKCVQDFIWTARFTLRLFLRHPVLFYNKDIFDRRNIAVPPDTGMRSTTNTRGVSALSADTRRS